MKQKQTFSSIDNSCSEGKESGTAPGYGRLPDPASAGAESSNTAPANCIDDNCCTVLRYDIDSLYLSYYGELSAEYEIRLEELKRLARSRHADNQKLAQIKINDQLFTVHTGGKFPYRYIISNNNYRISISGKDAVNTPLAYVQLRSEAITLMGILYVESELKKIIEGMGQVDGEAHVSRVDLCVDFITTYPLETIHDRDWVTRADQIHRHSDKRMFSGYSIGRRNKMHSRLYNKTLELEKSEKTYLYELWNALYWDELTEVWRQEFEYGREILRQFNIVTFPDLMNHLGGIWAYASKDWLRLTIPSEGDKTQSRWPTHPVWSVLQDIDWGTDTHYERRKSDSSFPPAEQKLFVNGLSGITSYMAREGIEDVYVGAPAYIRAARDYHNGREHITGKSFEDYVATKVQEKGRRFNTMHNLPVDGLHPADAAVAAEYKRQSDGE